jgi:hypothetical protein
MSKKPTAMDVLLWIRIRQEPKLLQYRSRAGTFQKSGPDLEPIIPDLHLAQEPKENRMKICSHA